MLASPWGPGTSQPSALTVPGACSGQGTAMVDCICLTTHPPAELSSALRYLPEAKRSTRSPTSSSTLSESSCS